MDHDFASFLLGYSSRINQCAGIMPKRWSCRWLHDPMPKANVASPELWNCPPRFVPRSSSLIYIHTLRMMTGLTD